MTYRSAVLAVLVVGASAAQAASVELSTAVDLAALTPGETFTLAVRGEGFALPVVGGGFDLSYDADVLQYLGVSIDTGVWILGGPPVPPTPSAPDAEGVRAVKGVYFNTFSFNPPAGLPVGSFAIGTLQFQALGVGTSEVVLSASPSFPFASTGGVAITGITYDSVSASVSQVPVPASLPLLVSALGGLAAWGRRRRVG